MKTTTKSGFIMLLLSFLAFNTTTSLFCQSLWHPSVGTVVTGDLMHAANGGDFIGVVYARTGNVYYNSVSETGIWSGETLIAAGTEARIAIDAGNRPHIVFKSADFKIGYTYFDGTNWSAITYIETNNAGQCSKPDIAVDVNGFAHITYTDTQGQNGAYTDRADIMYAVNASGAFVKTVIYNGFIENYGGSNWGREYYDKGSYIALDGSGNYYIMAHHQSYNSWPGGSDRQYNIVVKSNIAEGGTASASSDLYDIYDLEFNGMYVMALYRENVHKTTTLTLSGAVINFTNVQNITASPTLGSLSANTMSTLVTGVNSTKLFTKYNSLEHTYNNVTVKDTKAAAVKVNKVFYILYTDNGDGMIKIRQAATPLSLTSFEFATQTEPAVIDETTSTIKIEVPNGTDRTNLTPTFLNTSDVNSVKINNVTQVSGSSSNDYSLPVTYTLADGVSATREWTVTVTVKTAVKVGDVNDIHFTVSPNPAKETAHITLAETMQTGEITVVDLAGKILHRTTIRPNTRTYLMNVSNYSPGVYLVSVNNLTQKLIIAPR